MKKLIIVSAFLVLFSSLIAGSTYEETFELDSNSEISLGDYEIRHDSPDEEGDRTITIVQNINGSSLIIDQFYGWEIREMTGETKKIDEDLYYEVNELQTNGNNGYIDMTVNSSEQVFASSNITSDFPSNVFVSQDDSVTASLDIDNDGVTDDEYALSYESESPLSASFSFQDFNVSSVSVDSGETENVQVEIDVPGDTPTGEHEITLIAEGESRSEKTVSLEILEDVVEEHDPELEMEAEESYIRIEPDETVNIPVNVGSQGHAVIDPEMEEQVLEDISLNVEEPENWDLEVSPEEIPEMSEHDRETFTVTLTPPPEVEPGDYFVDIQGESVESEDEAGEVRITVTEDSILRYLGIVIMVLSLSALVIVYKRFGRR